jgi:hypothetical protein
MLVALGAIEAAMGQQNFWGWVPTQESGKREVTARGRAAAAGPRAWRLLPHLFVAVFDDSPSFSLPSLPILFSAFSVPLSSPSAVIFCRSVCESGEREKVEM